MKKIYSLVIILISTVAPAQNLEWARNMGGTGVDFGQAIAVDNAGNVYSTGLFSNTSDFDPGVGVFNLTSSGSWDVYIQKLDSAGIFQWAKRVGSAGDDRGLSIATDNAGIFLTGRFSLTVDFDPGAGAYNLTSAGGVDIFIMKLDASGNFAWAGRMGGTGDDVGNSIALDPLSNVHVTGYFTGNVNGITSLNSAGQTDIFILKLSTAGSLAWARKMGNSGLDEGNGIAVSTSGDVYSTGTFQMTVDFNPGGGNFNLACTGGNYWDAYIQKLDASGNFAWAKQIGSVFEDRGFALITDAAGNVYTTGYFSDVADFDPGPAVFSIASNSGGKDVFIQKLDAAGNFVWAKNVGGWLMDQGCAIDVDATGNVYASGFFQSTGDFDPGPGVYNLTATGGQDIFLLKLDASGNFTWVLRFGAGGNDNGYASMTAVSGSVYAAGFFGQTVDFDPGTGTYNLTSAGATDVFVLKLNDIQSPLPIELMSFTAAAAGNSRVKLDWVTSSEINNDYFTVVRSTDGTKWENVVRVDGSGNSTAAIAYEAWDDEPYVSTSYYRLKQTDFDGAFTYSEIKAVHMEADDEIVVAPNPTGNFITMSCEAAGNEHVEIFDVAGKLCLSSKPGNETATISIDITDLMPGTYFINFISAAGNHVCKKVVKM
jgi:hypothetical protein